jgi:RNA polymerase sigma-70 factor (family 1)
MQVELCFFFILMLFLMLILILIVRESDTPLYQKINVNLFLHQQFIYLYPGATGYSFFCLLYSSPCSMKVKKSVNEDFDNLPVDRFREGDEKVFHRLFTALFPVVCSFASQYLPASEAPEDVVQEAFIELWNQRAKFTGLDHIKSFLYLTVRHKCLNRIKHHLIKNRYNEEQKIISEQADFFEKQLLQAEVALNLREAIKSLPRQQRKIMQISLMGFTNEEIAGTLDISVNTVKLQKKIAYEKLRRKLKDAVFSFLIL